MIVAHGSRDPRHAATVSALTDRVRALRPDVRVETGYLDFCLPSIPRLLARLYREGVREVIALPLLLSRAFHAKTDIPAVLSAEVARRPGLRVRQADVLGPDPLLGGALSRRLREAGAGRSAADRAATAVVLASAGTTDPEALAVLATAARRWGQADGWRGVRPAFASASSPGTADTVRALRAEGARRVAVAPYVIAPGFLPDRIDRGARQAGADVLAPVLGDAPELASLLAQRYEAALPAHTTVLTG